MFDAGRDLLCVDGVCAHHEHVLTRKSEQHAVESDERSDVVLLGPLLLLFVLDKVNPEVQEVVGPPQKVGQIRRFFRVADHDGRLVGVPSAFAYETDSEVASLEVERVLLFGVNGVGEPDGLLLANTVQHFPCRARGLYQVTGLHEISQGGSPSRTATRSAVRLL